MAQHRWDTVDNHGTDGPDPLDEDPPGLRRRWAFPLPAAVLAVCLLLGCGTAVVLLRDRSPVPVASVELSPAATAAATEGGSGPGVASDPGPPSSAALPSSAARLASPSGPGESGAVPGGDPATLVVHVAGAVARPGVVRLPPGSRVVDAVDAAGGTAGDADLAAVNLAAPAEDGAMVLVPRVGEDAPGPVSTGGGITGSSSGGNGAGGKAGGGPSGSVNLNTADSDQLQTLPRVGPVLAERIIAWRSDHGRFSRPEDLDAVPGIGEAMMAALLPLVTV